MLLGAEELRGGVRRVAAELSTAYDDGVVLVAVLKGCIPFLADLVRAMSVNPVVEFMAISTYAPDSGRVRILQDIQSDIGDRDVVLVEEIVDTGLTSSFLVGQIRARQARSVATCALLDRTVSRIVPVPVRFRAFEVGTEFLVGYGLGYEERYRDLDDVTIVDRATLSRDPDSYVDVLYRATGSTD